ncbi:hypothetical protein GGI15_002885 [Coemansia interrupta]|uniref:Brl1/Brr6 domain-containing protein n=1 Tax=Coemansia interrupta TaxID=1126814 RepID=A0A9W8LI21_9FUNG|nr:hypothetical protein GGI15_002885 [Coemansia interrupta]
MQKAFLSPPLTSADTQQRAWTVVPRKLRGLHPSPVIIFVRENPALVTAAMDKLYATLVSTYNIDSREIRVTNVPTAYDLPAAVRRMGKDRHMVVVVGLLTRDNVWFDQAQVDRVRGFLVSWSQDACVPLIDGILVGDDEDGLMQRMCSPRWNIVDGSGMRSLWLDAGAAPEQPTEHLFGHYLAHRAMEMFYIEHHSDSDCSCRRPFKRQRSHPAVQEQQQPSTVSSSMASSVLLIHPTALAHGSEAVEYPNNSSGWSSLLDMNSAVSLLSSYTPLRSHTASVGPSDDVDEWHTFAHGQSQPLHDHQAKHGRHKQDSVFGRRQNDRPRVGPMDIDFDDRDSSWLNAPPKAVAASQTTPAPSGEPATRKRRLAGPDDRSTEDNTVSNTYQGPSFGSSTMGGAPFTFSMPSPATLSRESKTRTVEPMVVDWDPHLVSPGSPVRKQLTRRRQGGLRKRFSELLRLGGSSSSRARSRGRRVDEPSNGWTTDSEASDASSLLQSPKHSAGSSSQQNRKAERSRRPGRRTQRQQKQRRESEWTGTRGVDRVLALMGSKVDEPTVVDRLQMHRDLPYVISGYLQLLFNVFMVGTLLTIVLGVLLTFQRDASAKVQERSAVVMQEIMACSKQYVENRCAPDMRVPWMESSCNQWDTCMNQDPTKVGRMKIMAETMADTANGFIEPLTFKTIAFFLLLFIGTPVASNFVFGAYRHGRVHQQYVSQQTGVTNAPAVAPADGGASRPFNRSRSSSRTRRADRYRHERQRSNTSAGRSVVLRGNR